MTVSAKSKLSWMIRLTNLRRCKSLYEFYNSLNKAAAPPSYVDNTCFKATPSNMKYLPGTTCRLTCSVNVVLKHGTNLSKSRGSGETTGSPYSRS
ncbi:hypothetical protein TIFTF001_053236 [Ficus carica]|uniref:Uncharacterized protein n=1 Tax=Ficus carica TaxID=3494 RepID=A0AA88EHI0_FICCA|nr:hypothetical protein TIFTF001_053236 [Ficus carica]